MKFELKRIIYSWKFCLMTAILVLSICIEWQAQKVNDSIDEPKKVSYQQMQTIGKVTNDSINEYLKKCQNLKDAGVSDGFLQLEHQYPQYDRIIMQVYNVNDTTAIISKGDFFKDRVNSIKELVSNRHIYNRREKEKAKLLAEKTSKPFALGYGSDWGSIYSGLGLMGTLFSIAAICMGVDFSSKDRLISMDKILYTTGRHRIFALGARRIVSAILTICIMYIIMLVGNVLAYFKGVHYLTLNSPAIVIEMQSIYQDTIGSLFFKAVVAGTFAAVFGYLLAVLINMITSNKIKTLAITLLLFLLPLVVNTSRHLPSVVSRITSVLPCMAYVVRSDLRMYHTYGSLTVYDMILIVSIVGSGILAVLDLYLYGRKALNR